MPPSTPHTSENGLPSDLQACHDLIRELAFLLESKDEDIARLKERLQNMTRGKFGRSTEKLSVDQLSLFRQQLEDLLQDAGEHSEQPEPSDGLDAPNANVPVKKNGGGGRKSVSASVKRVQKHYFPTDDELVCDCGESKKEIGTVDINQLDYIPASFRVIQHITHKFACKKCQEGVVEGKRPSQILSGGKATEGLIAQISTAKYADHLPLYRQEQIYAREGVDVPRSSMGRWLDQSALSMKPIVDRMHELVLQSMMVEVDESPVRFLDKKILPKKSKMATYGCCGVTRTIHIRSSIFNPTERLHEPKTSCVDIRISFSPMDTADMSGSTRCAVPIAMCTREDISKRPSNTIRKKLDSFLLCTTSYLKLNESIKV